MRGDVGFAAMVIAMSACVGVERGNRRLFV